MSIDEFNVSLNTKKKKRISYSQSQIAITWNNFLFVYWRKRKKIERKTNTVKMCCDIRR